MQRLFSERKCIICPKTYTPTAGAQKYCSKCKKERQKQSRRKYYTRRKKGRKQAKIRFYEREKPIIDPHHYYMEQFKQLNEQFPDRKVSLEYDVKTNEQGRTTCENPRIVVEPVAQQK